jgi:hypothetical protein
MNRRETIKAAHAALCMDAGFDPFARGMSIEDSQGNVHKHPTVEALAALGYLRVIKKSNSTIESIRLTGPALGRYN